LRKALGRLAERGWVSFIGPEIEWYLLRAVADHLSDENIGAPGVRGRPIKTAPVEPGYHYHSESNMDLMQPVFDALGDAFAALGLGLRSIENEWGPGQVECTFAPRTALEAADNVFLFRTATRQICLAARLFRDVHVPADAQRLLSKRLAFASVADGRRDRR
jgi:glutamine synthetase